MSDLTVAVREWTPIGDLGFEYYWDPEGTRDAFDKPAFYWRKAGDTEYRARAFVDPEDAEDMAHVAWLLQQRTWDVEMSYRKLLENEG